MKVVVMRGRLITLSSPVKHRLYPSDTISEIKRVARVGRAEDQTRLSLRVVVIDILNLHDGDSIIARHRSSVICIAVGGQMRSRPPADVTGMGKSVPSVSSHFGQDALVIGFLHKAVEG
jgi:hypothetical protein